MKQKRHWVLAGPMGLTLGIWAFTPLVRPSLAQGGTASNMTAYAKQAGSNQKLLESLASWHKEIGSPDSESPDLVLATYFTGEKEVTACSIGIYRDGGATLINQKRGEEEYMPLPKGKLKAPQIAQISKLLTQLPKNQPPTSWKQLLFLTFVDKKKPQTRLYNRANLPASVRKIYQLTGTPLDLPVKLTTQPLAQSPAPQQTPNAPTAASQSPLASKGNLASKKLTNFTSKAAHFSIYFPVTPTEKRSKKRSSEGDVEEIVYHSKMGRSTYIVLATKIPKELNATKGTADFNAGLTSLRKGFETEGKGTKLIKSQKITQNGISGWEIQKSMRQGDVNTRIRIFVTQRWAYLVMAVSLGREHNTPSQFSSVSTQITKVLDSFVTRD